MSIHPTTELDFTARLSRNTRIYVADYLECEEFGCLYVVSKLWVTSLRDRYLLRKPFFYIYTKSLLRGISWSKRTKHRLPLLAQQGTEYEDFDLVALLRAEGQAAAQSHSGVIQISSFPWVYRKAIDEGRPRLRGVPCPHIDCKTHVLHLLQDIDLSRPDYVERLLSVKHFADNSDAILRSHLRYFPHEHSRNRLAAPSIPRVQYQT